MCARARLRPRRRISLKLVFRSPRPIFRNSGGAATRAIRRPRRVQRLSALGSEKLRQPPRAPEIDPSVSRERETIDNVDADVLRRHYNPKHPPFFNAYMHWFASTRTCVFFCALRGARFRKSIRRKKCARECNGVGHGTTGSGISNT